VEALGLTFVDEVLRSGTTSSLSLPTLDLTGRNELWWWVERLRCVRIHGALMPVCLVVDAVDLEVFTDAPMASKRESASR
jgi:transposase InsO family protein